MTRAAGARCCRCESLAAPASTSSNSAAHAREFAHGLLVGRRAARRARPVRPRRHVPRADAEPEDGPARRPGALGEGGGIHQAARGRPVAARRRRRRLRAVVESGAHGADAGVLAAGGGRPRRAGRRRQHDSAPLPGAPAVLRADDVGAARDEARARAARALRGAAGRGGPARHRPRDAPRRPVVQPAAAAAHRRPREAVARLRLQDDGVRRRRRARQRATRQARVRQGAARRAAVEPDARPRAAHRPLGRLQEPAGVVRPLSEHRLVVRRRRADREQIRRDV